MNKKKVGVITASLLISGIIMLAFFNFYQPIDDQAEAVSEIKSTKNLL